jgi:cardiolipin synthase A/B
MGEILIVSLPCALSALTLRIERQIESKLGVGMDRIIGILIWVGLVLLGLVAVVLVSLYIRGAFRWRPLLRIKNAIAPTHPQFLTALKSLTTSLQTTGEVIAFWDSIDDIQQARIAAIHSAQTSILFETFMMTPGKRADAFADAIAQQAIAGVRVQMLVDSYGTKSLPQRYWQRLRSAGVEIVFYNPFDWRAPANYAGRTHRKLLIIDGDRALIGGAGISDLWDGTEKPDDLQPWLDVEAAIQGNIVIVLSTIFQTHWQGHRTKTYPKATAIDLSLVLPAKARNSFHAPQKTKKSLEDSSTSGIVSDLISGPTAYNTSHPASHPASQPTSSPTTTISQDKNLSPFLVTVGNKPSYRYSSIARLKQTLIACATERIWLASPYFLPNKSTRNLLMEAKQAGIDVKVLTTSITTDKKLVYYASYEQYGSLLKAGVEIYEYLPSMLHAKMVIVDRHWVNIGSANFDYRSFLHNDELDVVTNNPQLIQQIEQVFDYGFSESQQINLKRWQRRSWIKHRAVGNAVRLVEWQL